MAAERIEMSKEYEPKNCIEENIINYKCRYCKHWMVDGCHFNEDGKYLQPLEDCDEFKKRLK
jgi:hypothetical protein